MKCTARLGMAWYTLCTHCTTHMEIKVNVNRFYAQDVHYINLIMAKMKANSSQIHFKSLYHLEMYNAQNFINILFIVIVIRRYQKSSLFLPLFHSLLLPYYNILLFAQAHHHHQTHTHIRNNTRIAYATRSHTHTCIHKYFI